MWMFVPKFLVTWRRQSRIKLAAVSTLQALDSMGDYGEVDKSGRVWETAPVSALPVPPETEEVTEVDGFAVVPPDQRPSAPQQLAAAVVVTPKAGKPANRYKFAAVIARVVKVKMSTPKESAANRLVAWELCAKEMTARDVRKVDMAHFLPLAVALVFAPSRWDVEAALIERTVEFASRKEAVVPKPPSRFWKWMTGPSALPDEVMEPVNLDRIYSGDE